MRRTFSILLSLVVLALVGASASAAAHLDPTFGKKGVVFLPGEKVPNRSPRRVAAIEPGGALILATNRDLQRLGPTGHLDRGFGEGGTVTPTGLPGGELNITGVAVDGQGRMVVVGTSIPRQPTGKEVPLHLETIGQIVEPRHSDARILRYLPNGTLDPSFGQGGIVETDFGLPTPEAEGVKLAAAPAVRATGVAVDGAGHVIVTGAAVAGVTGYGCAHDDYGAALTSAAFVGRLTESGAADPSFATGGTFGGRSFSENPLSAEEFAQPTATSEGGVLVQRGPGRCGLGSSGFFELTAAGGAGAIQEQDALGGLVADAAAAPDGSVFLLVEPPVGSRDVPQAIEKLRPDGTFDPAFGEGGKVALRLSGGSFANQLRVAASGTVLVEGTKVPRHRLGDHGVRWRSRFSVMLLGLNADGGRDSSLGPNGIVASKPISRWYEAGGLWLDGQGRATATAAYRPRGGPIGLAVVRFTTGA